MTAPYLALSADLVTRDHEQISSILVAATGVTEFEIPAESASVKFSEDWAPHVQASITAPAGFTDAQLAALDPRSNTRLGIYAGYRYQGANDLKLLANVGLRKREVVRPSNQLQITASSDEARAMDRLREEVTGLPTFAGINEAVQWLANYSVYPETAVLESDYANGTDAGSVAGLELDVGGQLWSPIEDAASRAGKWVYCTGPRKWRITAKTSASGAVSHALAVGKAGTVEESNSALDRTEWANHSIVEYTWTDGAGVSQRVIGRARVTSGPFSVNTVGYKTDHKTYERPATQAQANAAAASRVRNLVTRGRGISLSAVSAYWLRPGHTVSITLPQGATENHIVKSVDFDLGSGRMNLETRQPIDATITTGE
jgi:hypothetical protein